MSLAEASEKYFTNLEARGLDAKSIRTYRSGVDPFVQTCTKACVEDVTKQDMIDFMGWLRKQPWPIRSNSNPEHTYSNKVGYVAIFLKEFGVSRLLKKKEYPRPQEKGRRPPERRPSCSRSAYSAKASLFTKSKFVAPDCFVRRWAVGRKPTTQSGAVPARQECTSEWKVKPLLSGIEMSDPTAGR
jgi:Phage integrase, N-terminal SAM-like domain